MKRENYSLAKYIAEPRMWTKADNPARVADLFRSDRQRTSTVSLFMKGQSEMTQLSHIGSEFDRFLFAPLDENGEAPLSVLSALARQDFVGWVVAARLAHLLKNHAVNSLASTN